ncbi:Axial budding pattern protein 2 [Pichia kudriavzevii]|uniref:Axial budding pattern protein 2 n=1 Tax=Pichia kudriavzevii TaxID=4909 RepID=A0A1V2LJW4_PICKU|nr:Axial budding pattern protein 2 [Pichia kudriavzevii]
MNPLGIVLLLLSAIATANPYVGFPFSQQLPNIARVGENYQFTINEQTFKSDSNSQITYSVYELPSWLHFDTSSLTFSGLPSDADKLGTINFILEGADNQGKLNQSCSIVLSDQPAPILNEKELVIQQLGDIGTTNGYNGIVFKPQEPFKITFDKSTFQIPSSSSNHIVTYYGKSANRTSLPSWCFFDEDSLTFSGTTPPVNSVNAPSLEFDLTLIATDYNGYSAAYTDFNIVVGGHQLFINGTYNSSVMVNPGSKFDVDLPLNLIYLDNQVIDTSQIDRIENSNGPNWIQITDKSKLVGDVPEDQTDNIVANITLFDIYGDSVFMNFDINVLHEIFNVNSLDNVTVSNGKFFEYTLPDSIFHNKTATELDVVFSDEWLTFYHSNNTFIGKVPSNFQNSKITLNASINSLKQSLSFYLIGNPTKSSSLYSSKTSSFSSRTSLAIGLGVGIPVGVIILAAILFIFCCFRRRKNKDDSDVDDTNNDTYINDNEKGFLPKDNNSFLSSDTLNGSTKIMAANNLSNLEKDSDVSSYYSTNQSTLNDGTLYQAANTQMSTDQLLGNDSDPVVTSKSNANKSGVFNSWRKSSSNLKTRDSLNSLATVATNDLLTVNVVNDDRVRKSQMNLPSISKLRNLSSSSSSLYNSSYTNTPTNLTFSNSSSNHNSKEFNSNLETLRENDLSRESSYNTLSSNPQLVEFNESGSLSRKIIQREEKSYQGELYNVSDDISNHS